LPQSILENIDDPLFSKYTRTWAAAEIIRVDGDNGALYNMH